MRVAVPWGSCSLLLMPHSSLWEGIPSWMTSPSMHQSQRLHDGQLLLINKESMMHFGRCSPVEDPSPYRGIRDIRNKPQFPSNMKPPIFGWIILAFQFLLKNQNFSWKFLMKITVLFIFCWRFPCENTWLWASSILYFLFREIATLIG